MNTNIKTPYYQYDMNLLSNTLDFAKREANKYNYKIHYALKANSNKEILELIKRKGYGADCVSGNEVKKALEIGFENHEIVFAGVGKSDEEILIGLENEIFSFNCESIQELEVINELAFQKGKIAAISLRINPNVNANTHHYITTGLEENKFGINMWEMESILEKLPTLKNITIQGLHFHIGSQVANIRDIHRALRECARHFAELTQLNVPLNTVDVGGKDRAIVGHSNVVVLAQW